MSLKKIWQYKIQTVFIVTLLLFVVLFVQGYTVESSSHLIADESGSNRNFHHNAIVQADNGRLLCIHQNSTGHTIGNSITEYHYSDDYGETWSYGGTVINELSSSREVVSVGAGVSPNGTIAVVVDTRDPANTANRYGLRVALSYDNGSTWEDPAWMNTSSNNAVNAVAANIVTKGNVMYAPVYKDTPRTFSVYTSSDNGSSWSKLSDFGTYSDYSYFTICEMENGSFLAMTHEEDGTSGVNHYKISTDNCATWGNLHQAQGSSDVNIRDCDLIQYNGHYFLSGRNQDSGSDTYFWYSQNGTYWVNETYLDNGASHSAYTSNWIYGNSSRGQYELMITYSQLSTDPYCWLECRKVFDLGVYNYFQFQSINNQSNNTALSTHHRFFNWSRIDSAETYHLQIANESGGSPDWSDLLVDLNNITVSGGYCTNSWVNTSDSARPGSYNYIEKGGYVEFYLPYALNVSYGNANHYYRVRSYYVS